MSTCIIVYNTDTFFNFDGGLSALSISTQRECQWHSLEKMNFDSLPTVIF